MAQKRGSLGFRPKGLRFCLPGPRLLRCIVVEASQILQTGSVAELVLILRREKQELAVPTQRSRERIGSFRQGQIQLQPKLGGLEAKLRP